MPIWQWTADAWELFFVVFIVMTAVFAMLYQIITWMRLDFSSPDNDFHVDGDG